MQDMFNREVKVGDIVLYPLASGRSAGKMHLGILYSVSKLGRPTILTFEPQWEFSQAKRELRVVHLQKTQLFKIREDIHEYFNSKEIEILMKKLGL